MSIVSKRCFTGIGTGQKKMIRDLQEPASFPEKFRQGKYQIRFREWENLL
jgi:hypothetical protein